MKTEYRSILRLFLESNIECILIGGVAANLHGSPRNTQDIDFVYSRTPENLKRVVDALSPYQPYLRGAIPNLPFLWDTTTAQGFELYVDDFDR